jgi:hypothetical protein
MITIEEAAARHHTIAVNVTKPLGECGLLPLDESARDMMLAVVDHIQAANDPDSIGKCNSACDCSYGLLHARIEKALEVVKSS